MFDRCRAWRRLLSRRAEGRLTPSERALLDAHLSRCSPCRKVEAADISLRSAFSGAVQHMTPRSARTFDDRVLQALRTQAEPVSATGFWQRIGGLAPNLSFEFWGQLAGGALMAASVTAFFLVSALHPTPSARANSTSELTSLSIPEHNAPPVSLESLFQSRSPRAALLWATPGASRRPGTSEQRTGSQRSAPAQRTDPKPSSQSPRPHSEQMRSIIAG